MKITIQLDTNESQQDADFWAELISGGAVKLAAPESVAKPAQVAAPEPKAVPKPKAPAKPAAPVQEAPAAAEEPAADLRETAVQKATELVTTGQSQKVRDTLAGIGVKRVSDLADDQLEGFLAALG